MTISLLMRVTKSRQPRECTPGREPGWYVNDRAMIVATCETEDEADRVVSLFAMIDRAAETTRTIPAPSAELVSPRPVGRVFVDLPDHVVRSFEDRIGAMLPDASDTDAGVALRMLCEAWTEGAVSERVREGR